MEDLAGESSPGYSEIEAISGDGASSVLKQRGTVISAVLLPRYGSMLAQLTYEGELVFVLACTWPVQPVGVADETLHFCLISTSSVIDMVEKFLTRGYEEVAFISIGLVEVHCFRA